MYIWYKKLNGQLLLFNPLYYCNYKDSIIIDMISIEKYLERTQFRLNINYKPLNMCTYFNGLNLLLSYNFKA